MVEEEFNPKLFKELLLNIVSPANFGRPSQKLLYPLLIATSAVFENKLLLEYHSQVQANVSRNQRNYYQNAENYQFESELIGSQLLSSK